MLLRRVQSPGGPRRPTVRGRQSAIWCAMLCAAALLCGASLPPAARATASLVPRRAALVASLVTPAPAVAVAVPGAMLRPVPTAAPAPVVQPAAAGGYAAAQPNAVPVPAPAALDPVVGSILSHVLVLEYHTVVANGAPTGDYSVSVAEFSREMDELAATGVPVLTVHDLAERVAAGLPFTSPAAVVTFDDGYAGVDQLALPVLRQHHFPCTLFVIGSYVGTAPGILSLTELQAMEASGQVDLESHTWNLHSACRLLCASADAIQADLAQNDDFLAGVGARPVAFAYPGGDVTPDALGVVRAEYRLAFVGTLVPAGYGPDAQDWLLPRFLVYPDTDVTRIAQAYFVRHWRWWAVGRGTPPPGAAATV